MDKAEEAAKASARVELHLRICVLVLVITQVMSEPGFKLPRGKVPVKEATLPKVPVLLVTVTLASVQFIEVSV